MERGSSEQVLSRQALRRLPEYLGYLRTLKVQGIRSISAPAIARYLNYGEVQVRKDLAAVSKEGGKPKTGFSVDGLIRDLTSFMGFDNTDSAILVGAGQLGRALLSYAGFEHYGIRILAAFDSDESIAGTTVHGKQVFPVERLEELCRRLNAHIGIITTPAECAREICERMVDAGILAIWNFAPVTLSVPEPILVQQENMAASLAVLSNHLRHRCGEDQRALYNGEAAK